MTLPLLILRPEPGASQTMARAASLGLDATAIPLFSAGPLAWDAPPATDFDALLLTSANAPRFAADGLSRLADLPAYCVGEATATATRALGLSVRHSGTAGAEAVIHVAHADGVRRMLWLAGADRTTLTPPPGIELTAIPVYQAHPLPIDPALLDGPAVALVHSKRAARRLATLAPARTALHLITISAAVADAAGPGWASITIAPHPDDGEMVAMAAKLCHEGG